MLAFETRARRVAADGLPPLVALVSGLVLIASRVPGGFGAVFDPAVFARRDAMQYLSIAIHGYQLGFHCHRGPHTALAHVHVCGNVTWFAGYPLLIRAVTLTGLRAPAAGLLLAWLFWYLALLMIWLLTGPVPRQPGTGGGAVTRWLCLLLAAFFPGQIYLAAVFPLSMAAFGVLACCYWSARVPRWPLAAAAGVLTGSAYPAAAAVIPGLVIAAAVGRDWRARVAMCWAAGGVAAGTLAVLGYAQLAVGHWNAYFITEHAEYHVGLHDPVALAVARYRTFVPLPSHGAPRAVAQQGLLVVLLLGLALVGFVLCARAGLEAIDIILAITAALVWVIPYVGGGRLAIYRAEALLMVLVPLLRRLPAWTLVIPLAAAVWVAAAMAPPFFANWLV